MSKKKRPAPRRTTPPPAARPPRRGAASAVRPDEGGAEPPRVASAETGADDAVALRPGDVEADAIASQGLEPDAGADAVAGEGREADAVVEVGVDPDTVTDSRPDGRESGFAAEPTEADATEAGDDGERVEADAVDEQDVADVRVVVEEPDGEADTVPAPAAKAARPRTVSMASSGWVPHESGDIRGVLIQIGGGRLLLPNATIAEVLSYAEPEPVESAAPWLLGRFRWRGWQLPLVAFSRLAGIGEEQPGLGSKVIVLKALGGDRRIPFFAILTQGFPRLVTVSRAALEVETGDDTLPEAVQARVRLNDEPALLPDLLRIEHMLQADREAA